MKQKQNFSRKVISVLLSLLMVLSCFSGMGLTAYAVDNTAAEVLKPTVTDGKVTNAKVLEYAGKQWYVIASGGEGVQIANGAVTSQTGETTLVLLAKEDWRSKSYGLYFYTGNGSNSAYSSSNLKTTIDGLVTSEGIGNYYTSEDEKWKNGLVAKRKLAGGAGFSSDWASVDNINGNTVTGATLWPLSAKEVSQINNRTILNGSWWLRSPGKSDGNAACVDNGSLNQIYVKNLNYGVRPALCLNLTSDIFASKKSDGVYELTKEAPHNHNFTYSADGATLTATCNGAEGCDLTDKKTTLTITAPTLTTYGGTGNATATLTGLADFNTATGKTIAATDIKYVGRDGTTYEESTTAPTNAGKYTAKITVEAKTASVDYEIAKADPTAPTGLTATYGQTLANVTLPTGWTWADSTQSVGNVGTKTFKANFTPADTANYNVVENVDVTVKVSKANQTAPEAPTAAGKTINSITLNTIPNGEYKCGAGDWQTSPTFTGLDQNKGYAFRQRYAADANHNASAGSEETIIYTANHTHSFTYSASNGTITATCNGAGTCDLTDNKVSFTLTAPTNLVYDGTDKKATLEGVDAFNAATGLNVSADDIVYNNLTNVVTETKNAGTYQALYTLQTDFPRPFVGITFTVAKANPTYEAPKGIYAAYGDTLADVALPEGWAWVNDTTSVGDVGKKTFKANFTPADTTNYNTVENVDVTVKVNPADITPTVSLDGWTYGQTAKTPSVSGNSGNGEVTYTYATKGSDNFSATVPTNAGNYTVKATIAATTNYNGATATADFTIAKATPAIPVPMGLKATYGDTLADVTLPDGWAWVDSTQSVGDAGKKTFKANYTPADTDNYNVVENYDVTVKVAPADITPSVSIEGWNYGQEPNAPSVSGNSGNGEVTYTYATKGSDNFSETVPTNAGEYTVKATVAETTNYNGGAATADFTIGKAATVPATVKANNLTFVYDSKKKALVTVTGEAVGGEMQYALGTATEPTSEYTSAVPTAKTTGTYYVWYKVAGDENHNDSAEQCIKVTFGETGKKNAQRAMNNGLNFTQKGNKITVKWSKSAAADGYDVYVQYCGKDFTKITKTIKNNATTSAEITKLNGKAIDRTKNFKAYVVAYKMIDGKKVVLAKSVIGRIAGDKNRRYTSVKTIKAAKSEYAVKVGKTVKANATVTLVDKNKEHLKTEYAAKLRFKTSDSSIATVDENGNIKGIKKGTCTVYIYAISGKVTKVKVTVK